MHDVVKAYYGEQLQSSQELKTSACCDVSQVPAWLKPLLANSHPDVLSKHYGCGLVAPALLEGLRVLDLGCGAGRDVYALAQRVGAQGHVVGVDMTAAQLATARATQASHLRVVPLRELRGLRRRLALYSRQRCHVRRALLLAR